MPILELSLNFVSSWMSPGCFFPQFQINKKLFKILATVTSVLLPFLLFKSKESKLQLISLQSSHCSKLHSRNSYSKLTTSLFTSLITRLMLQEGQVMSKIFK